MREVFPERVPTHVDHLTWFTAESFGGPDRFTRELGFSHIVDEPFRAVVRSHVEFGSTLAVQNSHAETDGRPHPAA